jgi:ectoine hydroxylase-related dioxygenase (phytanoyl-CoA dioxygenase family)
LHTQQIHQDWSSWIEEHGYAVLPGIFPSSEISAITAELSRSQLQRSRAGARHILTVPVVSSVAHDLRLLTIAHGVLGETAVPFRATLFDKSPSSNWLVAWHQDTALPLAEKIAAPGWGPWSVKSGIIYAHAPKDALDTVLALRLHLDDSTIANGPLRVIPGTHRYGVLTDGEIQQRAFNSQDVACTVRTGGVVAMRPLVIHASSKSANELPRRVLHIEFASRLALADGLQLVVA